MKIAVFSDTHGDISGIRLIERDLPPLDAVFHLGDFSSDGTEIGEYLHVPCYAVRGNCDYRSWDNVPSERIVELGGARFFLTHGHLWNEYRLPPLGMGTILAHGHTHVPELKKLPCGLTIFNPGSISLPKGGSSRSFGYYDGENLRHYTI